MAEKIQKGRTVFIQDHCWGLSAGKITNFDEEKQEANIEAKSPTAGVLFFRTVSVNAFGKTVFFDRVSAAIGG